MTEEEKLDAGLYYDFWDKGVNDRKLGAIRFCRELKNMQDLDASEDEQAILIQKYFGAVGKDVCLCPGFMCDNGKNIFVGDQFLTNNFRYYACSYWKLCNDWSKYSDHNGQSSYNS